jgi:hypothetical protein
MGAVLAMKFINLLLDRGGKMENFNLAATN